MILIDTSGLLAALDRSDRHHISAAEALRAAEPPRLLSPFVLAELDYLIATRVSGRVARAFLAEVASGAYQLEPFTADDVAAAVSVLERYEELQFRLADASIVVLAERHGIRDVLTLDQRHFRALRLGDASAFRVLPADGSPARG